MSWIEKISKTEVKRRAGATPSLPNILRGRQVNFIQHVFCVKRWNRENNYDKKDRVRGGGGVEQDNA